VSPPTVSTAGRPRREGGGRSGAARRRAAVRRRKRLLLFCGVAVVVAGVALAMPLLRKTINEITLPLTNADVIRQQAAQKDLDPALIAGVIYAETKFDPRASAAGAQGLMQIMPQTAEFLAHLSGATTFTVADLADPSVNIAYGTYYLRYLLDEFRGNVTLALAAYNGGDANVDRWVAAARARGAAFTVQDIPFPETRAYVLRVLSAERDYRQRYAAELYG
jgi:soluble lytic murein transglycosylase